MSEPLPSHWRYEFLSRLGSGGTAEVFAGTDRLTGHAVALKVAVGTNIPRLRSEFSRLSILRHQGLVRAYDLHQDDRQAVMAMELIDGPSLEVLAGGNIGRQRLLDIWAQLAGVLKHFHQSGQVHGDIKPGNVMMRGDRAVLIDLGLAGARSKAGKSNAIGTPAYAAPEVLAGEPASPASDIYSLGLLVWELLAGKLPTLEQKMDPEDRWSTDPPTALSPAAGELIRAMLRHNPLDRVRDGNQLLWALAEAGICPERASMAEMQFIGRAAELRQAMAAIRGGKDRLTVEARPGTGATRFLDELKFLLQLSGMEAVLAPGASDPDLRLLPPGCLVIRDRGAERKPSDKFKLIDIKPPGKAGPVGEVIRLSELDAGDYRPMLGKYFRGAAPDDVSRLAGWLGRQAGGHLATMAALLDAMARKSLVEWERLNWRFDWPGILGLVTSEALPGRWEKAWESLAERQKLILKKLSLAQAIENTCAEETRQLEEWLRPEDANLRFVGEAVREFVIDRCTPDECAALICSDAVGDEPSPSLLRAFTKAGNRQAWMTVCDRLFRNALQSRDREAAAHYGSILADSGLMTRERLDSVALETAKIYRQLGRHQEGLELLARHADYLDKNWDLTRSLIVLNIGAGHLDRAGELAREELASGSSGAPANRIEARLFLGLSEGMSGDRGQGEVTIHEAEMEAAKLGDKRILRQAKEYLAVLAHRSGDWKAAHGQAVEGLALAGEDAKIEDLDTLVSILGSSLVQCRQADRAVALLKQFLERYSDQLSSPELCSLYAYWGMADIQSGDWSGAIEHLGLAESHTAGNQALHYRAFLAANSALAMGSLNQHAGERDKSIEAFYLYREAGDPVNAAICLGNAGSKEKVLGNAASARRVLTQALKLARGPGLEHARMLALKNMGNVEFEERHWRAALAAFDESRAISAGLGQQPHFETAAYGALAALGSGDLTLGMEHAGEAARLACNYSQKAWASFSEGLIMANQGKTDLTGALSALEDLKKAGKLRDAALLALAAAESPAGESAAEQMSLLKVLLSAEAEFGRLGDEGLRTRTKDAIVATAGRLAGQGPAAGQGMLNAFYQLAVLLKTGATPEQVGKAAIEQAVELTEAERGGLFLVDDAGRLALLAGVGLDPATVEDASDFSARAIRQAAQGEAEVVTNDALVDEEYRTRRSVQMNEIRSLACISLEFREGASGALYLDSRLKPGIFSAGRREFLRAMAGLIGAVVESSRLMDRLRAGRSDVPALERIIGTSAPMRELKARIAAAAPTGVNVLIEGETGTGKELVARAIHELSSRASKTFVPLDCGSLPESLLEAELFGHIKGAFTGATADKPGLFEAADGGTLFLDEITSASMAVQARLLRAVEEGEVRRVGDTKARPVDVRLICATNKDMEFEISEGRFKPDLFFRINEFRIAAPPLRDRGRDILALAEWFKRKYQKIHNRRGLRFSDEAQRSMASYPWPGNIREMENVVQKSVILAKDGNITEQDLELPDTAYEALPEPDRRKRGIPKQTLKNALRDSGGDTSVASKRLGITRRQVQRLIKKFRLAT